MKEDANDPERAKDAEIELARALAEYQDLYAQGLSPPPGHFAEKHPKISSELAKELGLLEKFETLVVPPQAPGKRFGQFEIIGELGRGGMGIVYEAWQETLDRRVALKVLLPSLESEPKALGRFFRECRTLAKLRHPNIVTIYAAGTENGSPYLAMELAEGSTLSRVMRQFRLRHALSRVRTSALGGGDRTLGDTDTETAPVEWESIETLPLNEDGEDANESPLEWLSALDAELVGESYWTDLAAAFAGVAEGLHHVHTRGIFHRDIKPSNLMLATDGRLRILDFGVARVAGDLSQTATDERIGTLLYMSPEQVQGKKIGAASDIYSLGATLYEMLVWRPPTVGKTTQEIARRIVNRDPPEPHAVNRYVPRGLETIVLKCLRKRPDRRYGSAEALAQDLRRFARGERPEADPEAWSEKLARRLWQRRSLITQAAGVLSVLVTAAVLAWLSYAGAQKEARTAHDDTVCKGLMCLLDAELSEPAPPPMAVRADLVPVLHLGDEASFGAGELGDKGIGSLPGSLQAAPRLFRAGPEPIAEAIKHLEAAIRQLPAEPSAHYHLARALLFRGNPEAAESRLTRVLELDPEFLPAMSLRAWVLERTAPERAQVLRAEVERRAKREGSRWSLAWLAAQRAVLEKRWAMAAELFDRPEASRDIDAELYVGHAIDTYLQRGVARLKTKRTDEALVDFGAAAMALSDRLGPRLLVARALLSAGRSGRANSQLLRLHDEAERRGSRGDEVALAAAALYREHGDYGAALAWLGKISPSKETVRLLHESDVRLLLKENERAWAAAWKAHEGEPLNTDVWFMLGNILRDDGKLLEARMWYSRISGHLPRDPRPRIALAACFELDGRTEEARKTLEAAVRLDPAFGPAHRELGRVRNLLGDTEGAIESYELALDRDPGDAFAANNLGTVFDRLGKREAARVYYELAVEVAPDFAHAHYNLGWLFHRERRYEEARSEYEAAIRLGLDIGLIHSNLAPCLQLLGDPAASVNHYEAAIELGFSDSALYHNYATALEKLKRYEEAEENYKKARDLEPRGLYTHLYLGLLYETMGKPESAMEAYRRGVDQDPGFYKTQEELSRLLLSTEMPLPQGDELRKEIAKLESAELAAEHGGAIYWLLEEYRAAYAPRVATYASIDRLFEAPHALLSDTTRWRYLLSPAPQHADDWTGPDFPEEGWREGEGPFGYPALSGLGTLLDGGAGTEASLFLRASFDVPDPPAVKELVLKVRADAAFAAYLNGVEILRRGPADGDGTLQATGGEQYKAWQPEEIALDPKRLTPGLNILALRVGPSGGEHLFVRARLEASPAPALAVLQRAQRAFDDFGTVIGGSDQALRLYFEGRLLVLSGLPARVLFEEVLDLDGSRPEPYVRLTAEYATEGDLSTAEEVARSAIGVVFRWYDPLWDLWLHLRLVDLAQDPREVLESLRSLPPPPEAPTRHERDIRWLLAKLAGREPLRINCGGMGTKAQGVEWGRDRFFLAGEQAYLEKLDGKLHQIEPLLDTTERYFWEWQPLLHGYRIPLPRGMYRVSLRFTEGYFTEPDSRRFDVSLEGEVLLEDYSPPFGIAEVHSREVRVDDGALDIDFKRRKENPKISALEIVKVE